MSLNLEHFRKLFLDMRNNSSLEDLKLKLESRKGDVVDNALAERDKSLFLKLSSRKNHFLKKIEISLSKIADGSFGECEECGDMISHNRLYARPTASCCISCKEELERAEAHISYRKKSHTRSKTFLNEDLSALTLLSDDKTTVIPNEISKIRFGKAI
jgi:DnaK suppressor protein